MADLSYTEIYAKTESELNEFQHDNLMGEEFVDLQSISAKRAAIYLVRETRKNLYPSIQEQLDMQYWDNVNGTTTWKDKIAEIKTANPLPQD
jgi:hypothetical protein|tara:strand:+ start:842 stop:1117 length:276 start_codon:yes stop_codon:yes gene_type:complete